jgi:hypothetical protein
MPMTVTVYFLGICTHVVKRTGDEIDNVRVVLVNASLGLFVSGGDQGQALMIPPHTALLYIAPQFLSPNEIGTMQAPGLEATGVPSIWAMKGVELQVATPGVEASRPTADPSYKCLPSLTATAQAQNPTLTHLDLNQRAVNEGAAAALFLIEDGLLEAITYSEAVHGKVTFTTAEDTAELTITRTWDRAVTRVTLQRGAFDGAPHDPVIIISNTGTDDDKNADFLLHYEVTTFTPPFNLTAPAVAQDCANLNDNDLRMLELSPIKNWTVTHGCSNSIYP